MTQAQTIKFWLASAQRNWQLANDLYQLQHYDFCLFICHLTLEKLLKAYFIKVNKTDPPYTHNLNKLAKLSFLSPSLNQIKDLAEITTFNVEARYEEVKGDLYKKATSQFTQKYLEKTKKLSLWLQKLI